jgi:hypothetical protein
MNVHVGTDVHPKRSQIAVLDAAGGEQRSRNLPNDPVKLVPVLGVLPPGTVAFEAAYGWAWRWSCWRSWSWSRTWSSQLLQAIASARLKNDKVDARTLASCGGPTCSPRPGSPHRSLDRNGGFQIGSGGRDRSLHDNERSSPLAHGPQRHSYTSSHPTVNQTATP